MPEAAEAKAPESVGHRIVRAMFIVIFFQIFWKFGGLIITVLVGSVFQAGAESDAYLFVSEAVIFLLQTLCLKIFIPVVVPIFKEQLAQEGEEAAWRFANTVVCLTVVALAALTVGWMIFAPQMTRLIAQGFNDEQARLATRLTRLAFPGIFALCLATVTYALLNSYNVFGYAAAGDAIQKMLWAGVFFVAAASGLVASKAGMLDVLAVGFVVAAAATLLTHLVGLRAKRRFFRVGIPGLSGARAMAEAGILAAHVAVLAAGLWACELLRPSLLSSRAVLALQQAVLVVVAAAYLLLLWWRARRRQTAMAKFAALVVPLLFGVLFAKYRDLLTNLFASFTGTGVFSDLKYARKIGEAPNTLIIAALSIAILPHLCELATGKKWDDFAGVMTRTIRIIVIFFVPLAALTVVLRRPIIQLLFDRGTWSDYHLAHAGDALGLYILALPFFAIENPIQQSFFAMQRMWTPTLVGFIGSGFHILFLFVGIEWFGYGYFAVVALVYMAARAFKNVILLAVMRYHVKILPWRESIVFLAKALGITLAVVLATHYAYQPLRRLLPLEPYRQHEVVVDTFNVELRNWESENVDELRIVSKDDDAVAEAFADVLVQGESLVAGENALLARYRRSPRRSAGLRRDLAAVALNRVRTITFDAAVSEPARLRIDLVTRKRQSSYAVYVDVPPATREHVEVEVADFGPFGPAPDFPLEETVGLWIRDDTPATRVAAERTTLLIDNLALTLHNGSQQMLDHFEPSTPSWTIAGQPHTHPRIDDTGERDKESLELALHLPGGGRTIRPLGGYTISDCGQLTFKARSDAPCTLTIALTARSSQAGTDEAKSWKSTVDIKASETRKRYRLPLSAFEGEGDIDWDRPLTLAVHVPDGVDFWLDNVAFVREPRGPRFGGVSIGYEASKLIHVAVPALVALIVFIVFLVLLRVEDARSIWEWLHERVIGKVLARLRRKRSDPSLKG